MSLFPAATETLFVLGAWDRVLAVSHECDFPPDVLKKPRVTAPRVDPHLPSPDLDAATRKLAETGDGLFTVDVERLRELRPDLLVVQGACDVCAVSPRDLQRVAGELRPRPDILQYGARTYEDVLKEFRRLGDFLGLADAGRREILKQWGLTKEIRSRTRTLAKVRVAVLDWLDPLMFAGHWTAELVAMAGGEYPLVAPGQPSRRGSWEELEEYEPDVIVAAPCGRNLVQAADELADAIRRNDVWDLAAVEQGRIFAADGNKYFNRPGPRLIYSAALLARAFHWGDVPQLPPTLESGLARLEVPRSPSPPRST